MTVFSEDQIDFIREHGPGMTAQQLVDLPELDGISRKQAYDKARYLGVVLGHTPRKSNPGKRYTPAEISIILAAHKFRTVYDVADQLERTWRSVYDRARTLGVIFLRKDLVKAGSEEGQTV